MARTIEDEQVDEETRIHLVLMKMSGEKRDFIDRIMEAWEDHVKCLAEADPTYTPTHYGFTYWLVRYSELIEPKTDLI